MMLGISNGTKVGMNTYFRESITADKESITIGSRQ